MFFKVQESWMHMNVKKKKNLLNRKILIYAE